MSKIVYKKYSVDSKNLSTLFLVLFWLLLFFIICFVGISGVFASTYYMNYNYQQQYYDNSGSSVSTIITSWNDSFNSYVSGNITTVSNSYGAGLSITSPIPLLGGHTYSMSVYFEDINNIALSSKNEISVASSLSAAANDYANNIPGTEMLYSKVSNNTILQFVFKVDNNHTHLFFPWTTTSTTTQTYVLTQVVMEDLGSSGITENEINQSLNSQTNEINNSIQNSTNTITGAITNTEDNINQNIDDMEQSIVESNKETQEVIKDQFNSCRDSVNLFDGLYELGYININTGTNVSGTTQIRTKNFIPIIPNKEYTISGDKSGDRWAIFYDNNKNYISYLRITTETFKGTFISPENAYYVKWYIPNYTNINNKTQLQEGSVATEYEPYGEEICTNKLDEQNETSKGIWATIKELPNMFLDMLLGLFIPDDLSFINEFKEVISNKLGFIASIPIQIIDFALNLVNVAFEEITTISFPSVSIFGFNFWNAEEIDITIMLEKLKPFRYFTDFTCVILCCRTLYDMYHKFTGGGAS